MKRSGKKRFVILWILLLLAAFGLGIALSGPVRQAWVDWRGEGGTEEESDAQWYISGMHPWIMQPEPGNCPICGMELTPLSPGMLTGELAIDPVIVRSMGVRIREVERGPIVREIWAPAEVTVDEALIERVAARASGYVERLYYPYAGDPVTAGEPLAEIHSPQIMAAAHELLAVADGGGGGLIETARARLRIMGVSDQQIDQILESRSVPRVITIESPITGYVREAFVREGGWLAEGEPLVELASSERVWMVTTLYENQAGFAREGAEISFRFPQYAGRSFAGTIDLVYPSFQEGTRQMRMRSLLANPEGLLIPGMFGRAQLVSRRTEDSILLPRTAIIDSGERQIIFVSQGEGRFDPREIETGIEMENGMVEVAEGVEPGEMVVVNGQFLLDSESRMREGLLKLVRGNMASDQQVRAAPVEAADTVELPREGEAQLEEILKAYFDIGSQLVEDTAEGIPEAGQRLQAGAAVLLELVQANDQLRLQLADPIKVVEREAAKITEANDVRAARSTLRDLSEAMRAVLRTTGTPASMGEVHEIRCPMYPELGQNSYWFQPPTRTANPYMGQAMISCMDQRVTLPVAGDPESAEPAGAESGAETPAAAAPTERPAQQPPAQAARLLPMATQAEAALAEILKSYLSIVDELVNDRLDGLPEAATALAESAGALEEGGVEGAPDFWRDLGQAQQLQAAAAEIASAGELNEARGGLVSLSNALLEIIEFTGIPESLALNLQAVRCPMYPEPGHQAWWIQGEGEVQNPYMGQRMPGCADARRTLPPRGETF